ncbi:MAG: c-type cytochrome biogenesis protein CcmI [Pseudomonadota bacterium]
MTFWLIAGSLILITLAVLLIPLLRAAKTPAPRTEHDLAVYRDQLAEVERDLSRGVLDPEEAEAARQEVKRRLLVADATPNQPAAARRAGLVLPIALALLVPAASLALYFGLGSPGQPSLPFAERPAPEPPPVEMVQAIEQLAARLAQQPEDTQGWQLLGRSYAQLGRFREAAEAFNQSIAHGDDSADAYANLGEMLAAAQNGTLGAASRQAFAAALERDPNNPRARYYGGLALAQDGRLAEALQVWRNLERDSPTEAPWRPLLEQQIAALGAELGEAPAAPGPSQSDVAAAAEMSPEERAAFIESMVARLASRLQETPDDLEGWLRLARAYGVLGRRDDGLAALERADALAAELPADAPVHGTIAETRAGLEQMPSP